MLAQISVRDAQGAAVIAVFLIGLIVMGILELYSGLRRRKEERRDG